MTDIFACTLATKIWRDEDTTGRMTAEFGRTRHTQWQEATSQPQKLW